METPNILRVTIEHDPDGTNPLEESGWVLHTVDCGVITDDDPESWGDDIEEKINAGLAYRVRYRERGIENYEIVDAGSDDANGVLVWGLSEPPDVEDIRRSAQGILEAYTHWANGNVHQYTVERIKSVAPDYDPSDASHNGAFWEQVAFCGDFIGDEDSGIKESIRRVLDQYPGASVIYDGEASWIVVGDSLEIRYRYTDEQGAPVLRCPECGTRWDVNHGISVTISVNGVARDHDTLLDAEGYLEDVDDAILNGYHAGTYCGDCGKLLANMPGVVEHYED